LGGENTTGRRCTPRKLPAFAKRRANKYTLRTMIPPKDSSHSWFARFFLPIIAAVMIDGISEALKAFGTFIVKEISYAVMLTRVDWDGVFALVIGTSAMIVALYFALKKSASYESHNVGKRVEVLVVALIFLGSTNLWEVALQRPTMRDRYNEILPGQSSLQDVNTKFLASWNQRVYFHTDEASGLCVNDCSFALVYDVPKIFGEGLFKLDFDVNKKVLRKKWYD
jgi:hypothetical protein